MLILLHNWNPLHVVDRILAYRRYGQGEVFVMPSAAAVQAALRKLKRYGVKTYAYRFRSDGTREFRVRSEQAAWARYLLAGNDPRAWTDKNPRAAARSIGFAGMVLDFFQRF